MDVNYKRDERQYCSCHWQTRAATSLSLSLSLFLSTQRSVYNKVDTRAKRYKLESSYQKQTGVSARDSYTDICIWRQSYRCPLSKRVELKRDVSHRRNRICRPMNLSSLGYNRVRDFALDFARLLIPIRSSNENVVHNANAKQDESLARETECTTIRLFLLLLERCLPQSRWSTLFIRKKRQQPLLHGYNIDAFCRHDVVG